MFTIKVDVAACCKYGYTSAKQVVYFYCFFIFIKCLITYCPPNSFSVSGQGKDEDGVRWLTCGNTSKVSKCFVIVLQRIERLSFSRYLTHYRSRNISLIESPRVATLRYQHPLNPRLFLYFIEQSNSPVLLLSYVHSLKI